MYIPAHFREDDLATLQAFIRDYSFGILVTQHEGVPFASHLPFIYDAGRGPNGTLLAHVARANPQWQSFDGTREALAIFSGPHGYVSPSWYEVERSVPTWNYATVHAYGIPQLITDQAELYELLKDLIQVNEAQFEQQWNYRLPEDYLEKMMRSIVGFTMPVSRLEGKYKMSQNRSASEQARVIAALQESNPELAQMMRDVFAKKKS
jgi:transcriptional regulator